MPETFFAFAATAGVSLFLALLPHIALKVRDLKRSRRIP